MLVLEPGKREYDGEDAPLALLGGDADRAPVALHDPLGDRQAESGARALPCTGVTRAMELAEDQGLVGTGDADPGVRAREYDAVPVTS